MTTTAHRAIQNGNIQDLSLLMTNYSFYYRMTQCEIFTRNSAHNSINITLNQKNTICSYLLFIVFLSSLLESIAATDPKLAQFQKKNIIVFTFAIHDAALHCLDSRE